MRDVYYDLFGLPARPAETLYAGASDRSVPRANTNPTHREIDTHKCRYVRVLGAGDTEARPGPQQDLAVFDDRALPFETEFIACSVYPDLIPGHPVASDLDI